MKKKRRVRGAKALSEYLEAENTPMSEATIYRLMNKNAIPFRKPSPKILIFDLDKIDDWLDNEQEHKLG